MGSSEPHPRALHLQQAGPAATRALGMWSPLTPSAACGSVASHRPEATRSPLLPPPQPCNPQAMCPANLGARIDLSRLPSPRAASQPSAGPLPSGGSEGSRPDTSRQELLGVIMGVGGGTEAPSAQTGRFRHSRLIPVATKRRPCLMRLEAGSTAATVSPRLLLRGTGGKPCPTQHPSWPCWGPRGAGPEVGCREVLGGGEAQGGGSAGVGAWGQSPSAPRHKQPPAPTSREQLGPNSSWKVPESVSQGAWGGEQVSREGEAWAWGLDQLWVHIGLHKRVPGDTLTARSQDAPPQGGGRHVIHSLPSVNARPSQLRRRMALTPAEPASIAGSSPPEARCQRPSVEGSGAGVALSLGVWCPAWDAPSS